MLKFSHCAAALAAAAAAATPALAGTVKGPSSSDTPYLVPVADGVDTISIFTVGDSVNDKPVELGYPAGTPYRMVGIPDGLGAFDNGDGETFTLLMNHELRRTAGLPRDHNVSAFGPNPAPVGADPAQPGGAFVSRWTISKKKGADFLKVLNVEDQIKTVKTWDAGSSSYEQSFDEVFARLCSANLAKQSAFTFDDATEGTLGTDVKIFTSGEEDSAGRGFAHVVGTRQSVELPRLGKYAFENVVASPHAQKKTIVAGLDDSDNVTGVTTVGGDSAEPSEVYFYVGNKTKSADPVEAAGLTNGSLYGVKVDGVFGEDRETGIGTPSRDFSLASLGNVENKSNVELQQASIDAGVSQFLRVEDGAWDPTTPEDFYFVTTDQFDEAKFGADANDNDDDEGTNTEIDQVGRTRLWRLKFDDINNPEMGGVIDMLLDGTEATQMLDNMDVDAEGNVIMQEDPGGQEHLGKVWAYDPDTDELTLLAQHDPARFGGPGEEATEPFTIDEESSGIIDVSDILGEGWYLADVEAHDTGDAVDDELVELGQLLAIHVGDADGGGATPIPLPGAIVMGPLTALVGGFAYRRMRRRVVN